MPYGETESELLKELLITLGGQPNYGDSINDLLRKSIIATGALVLAAQNGGGGGGATLPSTGNLIKGNGSGGALDSGIAPATVALTSGKLDQFAPTSAAELAAITPEAISRALSTVDRASRLALTPVYNGDVVTEGGKAHVTQIVCSGVAASSAAVLILDFSTFSPSGSSDFGFTLDGTGVNAGNTGTFIPGGGNIPGLPAGWSQTFDAGSASYHLTGPLGSGHTFADDGGGTGVTLSNTGAGSTFTDGNNSANVGADVVLSDRLGGTYEFWLQIDGAGAPLGVADNEQAVIINGTYTADAVAEALRVAINTSPWSLTFSAVRVGSNVNVSTLFHAPTTNAAGNGPTLVASTTQVGEQIFGGDKFLCVDATQHGADEGWVQMARELDFSASLNFSTIGALSSDTETITAPGVVEGDIIAPGLPKSLASSTVSVTVWAELDTIKVRVTNLDPVNPLVVDSVTVNAKAFR